MAEVSGFSNILQLLTGADAFTLLFPFILSWMLYYAAIDRTSIFEETSLSNAPPVMAMVLAFFTAQFLVNNPFYQTFFTGFFGKVVIGLTSLLGLYALMSFAGFDINSEDTTNDAVKVLAGLMAGAAFIWAGGFGPALLGEGEIGGIFGSIVSGIFETGFIWFIVIAAAMLWVMYPSGNDNGARNPVDDPDDDEDE